MGVFLGGENTPCADWLVAHRRPIHRSRLRNAIPYSLCGFQRVDALSEKLPQNLGEASTARLVLEAVFLGAHLRLALFPYTPVN